MPSEKVEIVPEDYFQEYKDAMKFEPPEIEIPPQKSKKPKIIRKPQVFYTPEESLAIMQFMLGEIHSKAPGREGRVAKRRVEPSNLELWERCRQRIGSTKVPASIRGHYHFNCRKLHYFQGLTLEEKVDLYYAMDIKVDPSFRKRLIHQFAVEFDENGVITGSPLMKHWDLLHSDSESEDQEDSEHQVPRGRAKWTRFTELEDGLMWQFILDDVNANKVLPSYGKMAWNEFKKKYKGQTDIKRAAQSLIGRYQRMLLPNLFRMPFDIETKAILYKSLAFPVPEEFREKLITETGVEINNLGIIRNYPNSPTNFVLQSHPYDSIIGITSPTRFSSLRHPRPQPLQESPYSAEENHQIWQYILKSCWKNGRMHRIKDKMTGWAFWNQFQSDVRCRRTWQSLAQHFTRNLMHNIMGTDYDLKTKIELYYVLSIKPDEEAVAQFESIASLVFLLNGTIRWAVGKDFLVGGKDKEKNLEDPRNLRQFMDEIAENHEKEQMSNRDKYPYIPKGQRKRKQPMSIGEPEWVKKEHVLYDPALDVKIEPKEEPIDMDYEKAQEKLPPNDQKAPHLQSILDKKAQWDEIFRTVQAQAEQLVQERALFKEMVTPKLEHEELF